MLGPQDIGYRMVVRRVVGQRAGRPLLTDALGVLTSVTDTELTLQTDSGRLVIARRTVVAAKRIPPRPPKRALRRPPEPTG